MMNRRDFVSIPLASAAQLCQAQAAPQVAIFVSQGATPLENLAAAELSKYLQLLYPENGFRVTNRPPGAGTFIQLGTPESFPELRQHVPKGELAQPDSFVVTNTRKGDAPGGIIVGADPRATLYAVYALLERLGYGFYLSYDAHPRPRKGPFRPDEWRLADAALTPERIVFNWHNFLSGCSGWNLPEWKLWIGQAVKMRFSSIMVHAYGNNPMSSFTHNGQKAPTGYVATTVRGRDWGTEHVNDVRRLVGGEGVFRSSVFGASAALVPGEQLIEAVTELMQQVFAFAKSRGLNVTFALDLDSESSNPQNIMATLPDAAVIVSKGFRLPNPDTPEGLAYIRSGVGQLLHNYPEIDQIALWFRRPPSTPGRGLMSLLPEELPLTWKAEYELALRKHPDLQHANGAPSLYAIGRIAEAYRKILDEIGKPHVQVAVGGWRWYDSLPAADVFMRRDVKFISIDQFNVFAGSAHAQNILREVGSHRKVVLIPYAQNDDGGYMGRSYTPLASFASLLQQCGSAGYGILHWTTRPLDLYFKSLSVQVWKETENQPLAATCEQMAARTFGVPAREAGGGYLARWAKEAPMFGRETSNRFLDVLLRDPVGTVERAREQDRSYGPGGPLFLQPDDTVARARERLDLLSRIDAGLLSAEESERLNYFRDFERFIISFFMSQSAWELSRELFGKGEIAKARAALAQSAPEEAIRQYVRMSSHGGISRGEQALIISLNLRWLPYVISQRQALGMEPVRIKFGPTQHEPLAQGAGSNTFYFDADHRIWKVLGGKETGAPVFARAADASEPEICRSGVRVEGPLTLRLGPITGYRLASGPYTARLLLVNPAGEAAGCRANLELRGSATGTAVQEKLDVPRRSGDGGRLMQFSYPIQITQGDLQLSVRPVEGAVLVCGVVLDPAG